MVKQVIHEQLNDTSEMEQNETFKSVEIKMKGLEHQLSLCDETIKQCEQSGREAEKEIEEHFAKCINALAERKAVLLKEASHKVTNQKRNIGDTRVKLSTSIEACKLTLKGSLVTYTISPGSAELIWKALLDIPAPEMTYARVITGLPMSLFDDIQKHGEVSVENLINDIQKHGQVGDTSRFVRADTITTLAGSRPGDEDGKGLGAKFGEPCGMCMNPNDQCLYICDYNSIRRLSMQGDVTTFVAKVGDTFDIAINHRTNCFYVTTTGTGHSVLKITSSGSISSFAGSEREGSSDGVGSKASFNYPLGVAVDQQTGNLFISDRGNHSIRKITPQGEVSTLAGSPGSPGCADGNGEAARFNSPYGIYFDENYQSLLVCDFNNSKLRRVQLNGKVSTLCDIEQPTFVAVTANETILVSTGVHVLYKATYQGSQNYKVEAVARSASNKRMDGPIDVCCLGCTEGIVVHEDSHSCFVVDTDNCVIRKISFASPQ